MKEIIFYTTQKFLFGFLIISLRFYFNIVFDQFSNQSFIFFDALDSNKLNHNLILSFYVGVMDTEDVGEFVNFSCLTLIASDIISSNASILKVFPKLWLINLVIKRFQNHCRFIDCFYNHQASNWVHHHICSQETIWSLCFWNFQCVVQIYSYFVIEQSLKSTNLK